jgi:hypothetical protein
MLTVAALVATSGAAAERTSSARQSIVIVSATPSPLRFVALTVRIEGHRRPWGVYVDGTLNNLSTSATAGNTEALAPGRHRIQVELLDPKRAPLRPRVRSRSTFVTLASPSR